MEYDEKAEARVRQVIKDYQTITTNYISSLDLHTQFLGYVIEDYWQEHCKPLIDELIIHQLIEERELYSQTVYTISQNLSEPKTEYGFRNNLTDKAKALYEVIKNSRVPFDYRSIVAIYYRMVNNGQILDEEAAQLLENILDEFRIEDTLGEAMGQSDTYYYIKDTMGRESGFSN